MIVGKMYAANITFGDDGTVAMQAYVTMVDDTLGVLGPRVVPETDPATIAQVTAFVEAQLPALSVDAGFPITLNGQGV